jgi:hypothetical protein
MAYCPKCGTPVAAENTYRSHYEDERRIIHSFGIAIVATLAVIAIILVALIVTGLVPNNPYTGPFGSGQLQTQQFPLTDFTSVQASNGFSIHITQADTYSVNVTTDTNLVKYLDVTVSGSTLRQTKTRRRLHDNHP